MLLNRVKNLDFFLVDNIFVVQVSQFSLIWIHGGDMASTWVQKQREQAELQEELLKHLQNVFANNDYALAA